MQKETDSGKETHFSMRLLWEQKTRPPGMHLTDAAKNIFRKKMWKKKGFIILKAP